MRFLNARIMGPAPGWQVPDLLTSVEVVAERLEQCARIPPLLVGQEARPQVAKHRSKGKRRDTRALQRLRPVRGKHLALRPWRSLASLGKCPFEKPQLFVKLLV